MKPLDLRSRPPRPPRDTILGVYFLPRTIDKLRAELPGGYPGAYLNHATGLSAYVVRRLGLNMNELRETVANAADEDAIVDWLRERINLDTAAELNAKLETFVAERMSATDRALLRERHPVLATRPTLSKLLDILEADDRAAFPSEKA
jgi:hypothetical protein